MCFDCISDPSLRVSLTEVSESLSSSVRKVRRSLGSKPKLLQSCLFGVQTFCGSFDCLFVLVLRQKFHPKVQKSKGREGLSATV